MSMSSIDPGTMLGKYRIDRIIGRGGGGHVYLAMQEGTGGFRRPVAIKILHDAVDMTLSSRQRLAREARIIACLQHRNIVQVHELGEFRDLQFLVMEYVEGLTLHGLLRGVGKRWPCWLGMHIGSEVARALKYAHTASDDTGNPLGIVHRDIKPSNILLSRQGDVKLTDFGTAKMSLVHADHLTRHGIIKGTPAYMSPEHRLGMPATAASDVYSLAVVIYEMCTGRRLEEAWDLSPPDPITAYEPAVPKAFDGVMARALDSESPNRPTALELAHALQKALGTVAPAELLPRLNEETGIWVERGLHGLNPVQTTDQTQLRQKDDDLEQKHTSPALSERPTTADPKAKPTPSPRPPTPPLPPRSAPQPEPPTNVQVGRRRQPAVQPEPSTTRRRPEQPPQMQPPVQTSASGELQVAEPNADPDAGLLGRRLQDAGDADAGEPAAHDLPPSRADDNLDVQRRMISGDRRWHADAEQANLGEPTRIEPGTSEVTPPRRGLFGRSRKRPTADSKRIDPSTSREPQTPGLDLEYGHRAQQTQLRIFLLVLLGLAAIALFLAWREGYIKWPPIDKPAAQSQLQKDLHLRQPAARDQTS